MDAQQALEKYFGFREFREPQGEVISEILNGQDVFVVDADRRRQIALLPVSGHASRRRDGGRLPFVALMKDQVDALGTRGLAATLINSTIRRGATGTHSSDVERGEFN